MSIDSEHNGISNLQIGPTDRGMVRIYIQGADLDLPMDFAPDDAREIAEELQAAALRAEAVVK